MAHTLSCYYLDIPLSASERSLVEHVLLGPWARFKTGARTVVERRVPNVLPLPDESGQFNLSKEQLARLVSANLRHAGILDDVRSQVMWVTPAQMEWDAIFQFAIREETGFAPYVLQRWTMKDGQVHPVQVRIVDTQKLIDGLERQ